MTASTECLVSALVSTYNAAGYFRACLENLVGQTLYRSGRLEIVIIDSGSQQDEESIARDFMGRYPSIVYLRTERETVYTAWNRAIEIADGRYVVNTNTDDTLREDALELLVASLEANPEADLAYASSFFSRLPNDRFGSPHIYLRADYPPYHPPSGMMYCLLGPHPMWRKSVFAKLGPFDASFRAAGDYEYQMRFIQAGLKAVQVDQVLSIFCQMGDGSSLSSQAAVEEARRIEEKYRPLMPINRLYLLDGNSPSAVALGWVAQGNLALTWSCPWEKNPPVQLEYALACFRQALSIDAGCLSALNNYAALLISRGNVALCDYLVERYGSLHVNLAQRIRERQRLELLEVEVPSAVAPIVYRPGELSPPEPLKLTDIPASATHPNPIGWSEERERKTVPAAQLLASLQLLEQGKQDACRATLGTVTDCTSDSALCRSYGVLCMFVELPQQALQAFSALATDDPLISLYACLAQSMLGDDGASGDSLQGLLARRPELQLELPAERIFARLKQELRRLEFELLGFQEGMGELLESAGRSVTDGALHDSLERYRQAATLPDHRGLFTRPLADKIAFLTAQGAPCVLPPLSPVVTATTSSRTWVSRLCCQEDFHTPEYQRLCRELDIPPDHFERKNWEYFFVTQGLRETGLLAPDARGLGFGVGREKLISYFARHGCSLLATDLEPDHETKKAWVDTNQHSDSLQDLFVPGICDYKLFASRVRFRYADMNRIPEELQREEFDFTWSCCSFEHVGSIELGKQFILNQMRCLKPGGIALHTTEFNLSSNELTVDQGATVIFRRRDIDEIAAALRKEGHEIILDYSVGEGELDRYIDLPPYLSAPDKRHLRLLLWKYVTTSIGLFIRKRG